jgi:uncharacterized membrane protein
MMAWMWYVALAVIGLSAYNITGKLAGGKIEPLLSTSIACLTAGLVLSLMTFVYYWKNGLSLSTEVTTDGVKSAAFIGLAMIIINIGYIFAFSKGGPIGAVGPIISGASIGVVIMISAVFFGEGMSINKILGALSLGIGIMFLIKG